MAAQQSDTLVPQARPTELTNAVFTIFTPTKINSKLVGGETETT